MCSRKQTARACLTLLTIIPLLLALPASLANGADTKQAAALMEKASQQSRAGQYDTAAKAYQKALTILRQTLAQTPDDDAAKKQLANCRRELCYCIDKTIRPVMNEAQQLARDGKLREASDQYVKAATMYAAALAVVDSSVFKNNRVYCLDRSGLEPIRHADQLNKQGEHEKAAELYALGIARYQDAEKQLGENRFARNLEYATQKCAQCRYAARLQRHDTAPEFDLEGPAGRRVRLADFRGKPVLLVLWAGWCGVCRSELPELEALYADSADRGLVIVGICLDSVKSWDRRGRETARKIMENDVTFPVCWATEQTVIDYGCPNAVPTFIWIDAQGRLVRQIPSDEVRIIRLLREFESLRGAE